MNNKENFKIHSAGNRYLVHGKRIVAVLLAVVLFIASSLTPGLGTSKTEAAPQQTGADLVVAQAEEELELGINYRPNKYTQWFPLWGGSTSYEWCASFVSWVAYAAGESEAVPATASPETLRRNILGAGGTAVDISDAQGGDIVFFYQSGESEPFHVGIMRDNYYTIEGNVDDAVRQLNLGVARRGGKTIANGGLRVVILRPAYKNSITYATNVDIVGSSAELRIGNTLKLIGNVTPVETTDSALTWTSSNSKVVSVDKNGVVTAKSYGTAVITAVNKASGLSDTFIIQTRFSDVIKGEVANSIYKTVYWAADLGIAAGFKDGAFGYEKECTRAQMIIFLWRLAGKPKATKTVNFTDIDTSLSYYEAIQWAVENKITTGYREDNTFRPDETCTRRMAVLFLWRLAGRPVAESLMPEEVPEDDTVISEDNNANTSDVIEGVAGDANDNEDGAEGDANDVTNDIEDGTTDTETPSDTEPELPVIDTGFIDVTGYENWYPALAWAVEQNIISGYDDGTFRPDETCIRAHMVIMLYRYARSIAEE